MLVSRLWQRGLLVLGVIVLIALLADIALSLAATTHGSTVARVVHVKAGSYPLTVSLYKAQADAGYAFPFAIAPQQGVHGAMTYNVTSIPGRGVDATPVQAAITPDAQVPNGAQATAEITVRGTWMLHMIVTGPQGRGVADVPITVVAPPAVPQWLGWLVGAAPLYGLLIFLLMQRGKKSVTQKVEEPLKIVA